MVEDTGSWNVTAELIKGDNTTGKQKIDKGINVPALQVL